MLWTPFELARREAVEAGYATVADLHKGADDALVAWAVDTGRSVYIGRRRWQGKVLHLPSIWRNTYTRRSGTVQQRVAKYAAKLDTQPVLLARLPELEGLVLCCWCAPALCHGEVLLKRLQDGSFERYQAAVEAHRKASTAVVRSITL